MTKLFEPLNPNDANDTAAADEANRIAEYIQSHEVPHRHDWVPFGMEHFKCACGKELYGMLVLPTEEGSTAQ